MAELEEVRRRGASAALVVDLDRPAGPSARSSPPSPAGCPAARTCSTSGCSADTPTTIAPSTMARASAPASDPWSGEMNVSA